MIRDFKQSYHLNIWVLPSERIAKMWKQKPITFIVISSIYI